MASLTPGLAAPRKRAAARPKAVITKAPAKPAAPALKLEGTIDDQIALLERSAAFWQTAGVSIEGTDQKTAWFLALVCREQALLLRARKAKREGRGDEASRLVLLAENTRRQWKRPALPQTQTPGMGMGMEGMSPGMEGMASGMEPGMGGMGGYSPGMEPGMGGMGGYSPGMEPGMGGAPPGMEAGMGSPPMAGPSPGMP